LTPDQKVLLVLSERKNGPVMMVGDGVNDAPALAAADIGVAMGARGAAASAEAADVVLLVDHLDRLLSGLEVSQKAQRIALESVARGYQPVGGGHDRRSLRLPDTGRGRLAAGGDRCRCHSECASGPAHPACVDRQDLNAATTGNGSVTDGTSRLSVYGNAVSGAAHPFLHQQIRAATAFHARHAPCPCILTWQSPLSAEALE
jgi:hypothetical protein